MLKTILKFLGIWLAATVIFLSFDSNTLKEKHHGKLQFLKWASQFSKNYNSQSQLAYRFEIYKYNKQKVQAHNKQANAGKWKYFMGLNSFADMSQLEFKSSFGKLNYEQAIAALTTNCSGAISDTPNPPDEVNWTQKAVDKTIKTEGKCAANWAFSSVAAVEGLYALKIGTLIKLSDQQVIDCSGNYGNQGCGGGFMEQSFHYIIDNGLTTEKSYPYVGKEQSCTYSQSQRVLRLGRCAKVPTKNYEKLLSAVVQQPVSVALASQKFMLYQRGIFDGECTTDIDRGMLLVGYGVENQQNYWLLKNFLGIGWGQKGYMRLKRETENGAGMCGIQLAASVPQNLQ